jgi:glutamate dehydrogenase (NADP+)
MAQNSQRLNWTREKVDEELHNIMISIHKTCVKYGKDGDFINYVKGANIGGFVKVAEAMLAQGHV